MSGDAKAVLAALITGRAAKVRALWDKVADEDPARAIELYAKLGEYVMPKLGRTELAGKDDGPVVVEILKYVEE